MTRRRAAVSTAVPLLLAGLLAVPAAGTVPGGAAGTASWSQADLQARALAVAAQGATVLTADASGARRLDRDVRAVLAAPGTDAAGRAAALARATTALTGRPVLLLPHEEEQQAEPVGATTSAVPAGDLDGDGLDDVVTYAFGAGDEVRLQGRRGTDGAILWEQPLSAEAGFAFPLGEDLTGDGRADLLLDRFELTGTATVTPVTQESTIVLRQTYGVVSGADGRAVWTRSVDGTVVERRRGVTLSGAGAVEGSVEATGLVLAALADAGQGRPAVLESVVDVRVRYREVYGSAVAADGFSYEEVVRSSTRASVVDAATGTGRPLRTAADVPGLALLLPAGDLDDDRSAEALWTVQRGPDTAVACAFVLDREACRGDDDDSAPPSTAELLRTTDGGRLWQREDPGPALYSGLGADADGDGAADLVRQQSFGGLEVLSGRDGQPLWGTPQDEDRSIVALDGPTLVLLGLAQGSDGQPEVLVEHRSTATGGVVAADRRPLDLGEGNGFVLLYAQQLDDGDGDGGQEVLVGTLTADVPADGEDETTTRSEARVLPVAGGTELLVRGGDDPRFLLGYPDLDGDGLAEVVEDVITAVGDDPAGTTATALRLVDGAQLWQVSVPFSAFPHPGGEQDGRAGAELLAGRVVGADLVADSLRGADLGLRWTTG